MKSLVYAAVAVVAVVSLTACCGTRRTACAPAPAPCAPPPPPFRTLEK